MGNNLVLLHKELGARKQSEDVKQIRAEIEERLHAEMRNHFLDLLDIGSVVGYERLKTEMQKSVELLDMLQKK